MNKSYVKFAVACALGFLLAAGFGSEAAQARKKITCRSIGLTYNPSTHGCNYTKGAKAPRYKGRGNKNCVFQRPPAVDVAAFTGHMANSRVPHMQPPIFNYVTNLKKVCPSMTIQSTYRDCSTNMSVRGVSRSRHLCGAAADTSNCGGATAKGTAKKVCNGTSGLMFVDEGPAKFPHCQIKGFCH